MNFRTLIVILLFGCHPRQEISPLVAEIIIDYQYWIDNNVMEIQEILDGDPTWDHNILSLDEHAWTANYYERVMDDNIIARTTLATGDVELNTTQSTWEFILDDYQEKHKLWLDCDVSAETWKGQFYFVTNIFCHESAHAIGVTPHADVYAVGHACRDLWWEQALEYEKYCRDMGR